MYVITVSGKTYYIIMQEHVTILSVRIITLLGSKFITLSDISLHCAVIILSDVLLHY